MGYRLHVAKKYEVELGDHEAFNWKIVEFHELLSALGVNYSGEVDEYSFEVDKEQWKNAIEKLNNINSIENKEEKEHLVLCIQNMEEDAVSIANHMQQLLREADSRSGFLHLFFV